MSRYKHNISYLFGLLIFCALLVLSISTTIDSGLLYSDDVGFASRATRYLSQGMPYDTTINARYFNYNNPMVYSATGRYAFSPIPNKGSFDITFIVPEKGKYVLQVEVLTPTPISEHNSFYVGLDGQKASGNNAYLFETLETTEFAYDYLAYTQSPIADAMLLDPAVLDLTAGKHKFTFYAAESDTRIKSLKLIKYVMAELACIDNDHDGHYALGSCDGDDCDDTNPEIRAFRYCNYDGIQCGENSMCVATCPVPPEESCSNNIDDNCDKQVNEGCPVNDCVELGYKCTSPIRGCGLEYNKLGYSCPSSTICCEDVSYCGDGICDTTFTSNDYDETVDNCPQDCIVAVVDKSVDGFPANTVIEAENGVINTPMIIDTPYVYTTTQFQGSASYSFNVPEEGDYYLEVTLSAASQSYNSFFVGLSTEDVNGNTAQVYDTAVGDTPLVDNVSIRGSGGSITYSQYDPMMWHLTPGVYTFVFYGREKNTKLDTVILKSVATISSCIDADNDGHYAISASCIAGDDCNDANAQVYSTITCSYNSVSCGQYTLCTATCPMPPAEACNGIDDNCDDVIDEGCGFRTNERIEAENGENNGFIIANGYVYSNANNANSISYTFYVPQSGQYVIETGIVNPTSATDSYYVGLDDKVVLGNEAFTYDTKDGNGIINDVVRLRGPNGNFTYAQYNPMIWNLTSGNHKFTFYGRERNTKMDYLSLRPYTLLTVCNAGNTRLCTTGLSGVCSPGTQTCNSNKWGSCIQNIQQTNEVCGNNVDENCDGVVEACPNVTNNVIGGKWYVDNAVAINGNGQSWNTAWKTFAGINWTSIQPGDTIYVSGGTTSKTYTETFNAGKSGVAGSPITITKGIDSGHDGVVIFDGQNTMSKAISVTGKSYLTFSGFKMFGFGSAAIDIRGGVWGNAPGTWPYIIPAGTWPYIESSASKYIIIENMDIFTTNGRGVFIQTSRDIIVRNNYIESPYDIPKQTDGIYSQYTYNNLYENNYIVMNNINNCNSCHNDGIQTSYDTNTTFIGNFIFQNNSKTNNAQGIYAENSIGHFRYYNNVYDAGNTSSNGICFKSANKAGTVEMIGNTAYGRNPNMYNLFWITDDTDPVFKNNIAYSLSIFGTARIDSWAGNPANIDYNVLYAPNSKWVYVMAGGSSKTWSYSRELGWDVHSYNADPQFTNIATMNYRPKSTSPAINQGTTTSIYIKDKDGIVRDPVHPTIGAYEKP